MHFPITLVSKEPIEDVYVYMDKYCTESTGNMQLEITETREDLIRWTKHSIDQARAIKKQYENHTSEYGPENYDGLYEGAIGILGEIPEDKWDDNETLYQFAIKDFDECEEFNENGDLMEWWNPDAFMDWCEIGGRWSNYFTFKDGTSGYQGKFKDIVFSMDLSEYNRKIQSCIQQPNFKFSPSISPTLMATRNSYIHMDYIVLTEKDECIYVSEDWPFHVEELLKLENQITNEYIQYIQTNCEPDDYLTIVDCHT